MKKLFIALIILLFSVSFVHAVTIASGSVTRANSRLSLVDGTAFVDFSAAGTLTAYLGQKLTITDSENKKAVGYIKAAGSGETLGDSLTALSDIESVGWFTVSASRLDANTFTITSDGGYIGLDTTYAGGSIAGKLFKSSFSATASSGGTVYMVSMGSVYFAMSGESDIYTTAMRDFVTIGASINKSGNTIDITSAVMQQVLTPSATGVTITSTPNGTTYNWTSIESGFNYNDASGYTYTIESVGGGGSLLLLGVGK